MIRDPQNEPKGVVVFDLDDLLIMNVHWYWAGWQMFKDAMMRLGFSKYEDELVETLNHFDAEGVKVHGFKKERFGESMGEAYEHFCKKEGKEPDAETREGLVDIGHSVFRHKPILYPNARSTLRYLDELGYDLYCVTKGDGDVQHEKICSCDLDQYFCDTYFVPLEKKAALEQIMEAYPDLPRDRIYFVGNSPKDDMKPAIDLGINAILIYEFTWDFDELEFEGRDRVVELDDLAELMEML